MKKSYTTIELKLWDRILYINTFLSYVEVSISSKISIGECYSKKQSEKMEIDSIINKLFTKPFNGMTLFNDSVELFQWDKQHLLRIQKHKYENLEILAAFIINIEQFEFHLNKILSYIKESYEMAIYRKDYQKMATNIASLIFPEDITFDQNQTIYYLE